MSNFTDKLHSPEKYFIVKINIWNDIVWALIAGFLGSVLIRIAFIVKHLYDTYDPTKEIDQLIELVTNTFSVKAIFWFFFWFIVVFIFTFVVKAGFFNNIAVNNKLRKADYAVGKNLFDLIGNLLKDLDSPDKTTKMERLKETSYFLKVNNARTGRMLKFHPDNPSINQLHQVEGMVSVTQADPSEWLNPTYNFFLVNNYIASLINAITLNSPVTSIRFAINRNDVKFKEFENNRKEVLRQLSQLSPSYNLAQFLSEKRIFIRFYILSENEIENNKSIIETLIAGHDLFGCYLYFINEKFYKETLKDSVEYNAFEAFLKSLQYNLVDNLDKIDIAITKSQNKLNAIYRKGDDLALRELEDNNTLFLQSFLRKLSADLYNHYEEKQFLLDKYFIEKDFVRNNEYCYLFFENNVNIVPEQ